MRFLSNKKEISNLDVRMSLFSKNKKDLISYIREEIGNDEDIYDELCKVICNKKCHKM